MFDWPIQYNMVSAYEQIICTNEMVIRQMATALCGRTTRMAIPENTLSCCGIEMTMPPVWECKMLTFTTTFLYGRESRAYLFVKR
jgi:hypothetical protein